MKKYQVKPGRQIVHGGVMSLEGQVVELTDVVAAVHAENIELLPEPKAKGKPAVKEEGEATDA
ncbi:hypothetical protein [Anabaena catenula]|uniref:Uncharacterized protein n=1 Tax=Anabaena catenula FACHB-362 TaxID=2692877 RepID=A0ABR8JA46_9NOST|nr:hypothetical protein [Anabaena catenula]MBD2694428.1 hypothetical protein [Anabaena catenula FACHB-362]